MASVMWKWAWLCSQKQGGPSVDLTSCRSLCVESPLDLLGLPIYVLILGLGLLSPESVVGGVQGLVLGKGRPSTYYEELAGKGLT